MKNNPFALRLELDTPQVERPGDVVTIRKYPNQDTPKYLTSVSIYNAVKEQKDHSGTLMAIRLYRMLQKDASLHEAKLFVDSI